MTRISAVICAVLLTAAAFGAEQKERTRPDEPFNREGSRQREVAPLLYALPALSTNDIAKLEIRIVQVKYQLVRETLTLPASVPAGAAVDVLFTHAEELTRLRAIEANKPGSLRFIALIDGRVVTDEPFANIEAAGKALSLEAAVGRIDEIEVRPTPKPRVRALYKDPACADQCETALNSCLDWCDPRGDSCNQCWSWHWSCWSQCGDLPDPCTEPKSTSTYTTTTYDSSVPYGTGCYLGKQWTYYSNRFLVSTYQRTEHCDGSHTDSFIGSYYTYNSCWVNTGYSCYGGSGYAPSPQC